MLHDVFDQKSIRVERNCKYKRKKKPISPHIYKPSLSIVDFLNNTINIINVLYIFKIKFFVEWT